MRTISIPLSEHARRALIDWAEREFRDPRDQAAKFVVDGLRQAGALSEEPKDRELTSVEAAR